MPRKPRYDFHDKDLLLTIEGLIRDGASNKDIADYLGLNQTYFSELVTKFPELSETIKRAHKPITFAIENSMIKRCLGMKVKTQVRRFVEEKCKCGGNPDCEKCMGTGKFISTTKELVQETETEIPPSDRLIPFYLMQRKPEVYNKQPQKIDATVKPLVQARTLTKEEAKQLWDNLEDGKFPDI